jgi:hypothetical protein
MRKHLLTLGAHAVTVLCLSVSVLAPQDTKRSMSDTIGYRASYVRHMKAIYENNYFLGMISDNLHAQKLRQ